MDLQNLWNDIDSHGPSQFSPNTNFFMQRLFFAGFSIDRPACNSKAFCQHQTFMQSTSNDGSKPTAEVSHLCSERRQNEKCCRRAKPRAAAQRENRPSGQVAANLSTSTTPAPDGGDLCSRGYCIRSNGAHLRHVCRCNGDFAANAAGTKSLHVREHPLQWTYGLPGP